MIKLEAKAENIILRLINLLVNDPQCNENCQERAEQESSESSINGKKR